MKNIFLNIIILFSPNYINKKEIGTVMKKISLMNQFLTFYKTIKQNLKSVKYDISIIHFKDFNENDILILKNMDINLIKINTTDIRICAYNRYIIKTKIKGTHRLIAETDMLMFKEPIFNWDVDFQAMYAGTTPFYINIMNKIYKTFHINIGNYKKNYNKNKNLFVSYNIKKINKDNLFPHFNNGLLLLKEEFSERFYNKITSLNLFKILDTKFPRKISHHGPQVVFSLLLVNLTNNWKPFEPGINYLLKMYDVNKFGKQNISLLHYCGKNSGKLVKKKFPEYFK